MHRTKLIRPSTMACCLSAMLLVGQAPAAPGDARPFLGDWALDLPHAAAGWLGVEQSGGQLRASLLWGGGSVLPLAGAKIDGDKLVLTRIREGRRKDAKGKVLKFEVRQTIVASAAGEKLALVGTETNPQGKSVNSVEFTGVRLPPMPPAPDLASLKYGEPIVLFDGKSLAGWTLTQPDAPNGWSAENGVLVNRPEHEPGKPHKRFGNLRTQRLFEDFRLTLEVRVPPGGNSGIYLRGIYEVQVSDTHGQPLDSHNMGAIYSRIAPTQAAEKPAGQWQSFDITLADRHVTVILNGKRIIDNQPLRGCTGGALWSDPFRPGPIYLQGDHTAAEYRNLVLRPIAK